MTLGPPLQPKRHLKELRDTFRIAKSFDHGGELHAETLALLEEILVYLTCRTPEREAEARAFLLRCMGAMAHARSDSAYEPHGFANPFAFPAFEGLPPIPSPPAWPPTLLEPSWNWPVIHNPPDSGGGGFTGTFRDYSALKMFGYTVGKKEGWPQAKRQSFLTDFMEMDLPPIVEATFGDDYGEPMSTSRLRKMANVIATNASNFYRNDATRYRAAIKDWEADLDFLKIQYHIGKGLAFQPWPSTRPE